MENNVPVVACINAEVISALHSTETEQDRAAAQESFGFPWTRLYGWKATAVLAAVGLPALSRGQQWTRIGKRADQTRAVRVVVSGTTYRVSWGRAPGVCITKLGTPVSRAVLPITVNTCK